MKPPQVVDIADPRMAISTDFDKGANNILPKRLRLFLINSRIIKVDDRLGIFVFSTDSFSVCLFAKCLY